MIPVQAQPNDDISHPAHYTQGVIECIDLVEQLSFNLGAAVKYQWRYRDKGYPGKDLRKAAWFLRREQQRCKKMWLGARILYWWKVRTIAEFARRHERVGVSSLVCYTLEQVVDGDFAEAASHSEALAACWHE